MRLDWDSEFFGYQIARVVSTRLTASQVADMLNWCDARGTDCLYFLADLDDRDTIRLAEANQFRLVDVRIALERRIDRTTESAAEAQSTVSPARPEDIPALRAIARTAHTDSRFYFDGNFPRCQCDALYETWIEKSCRGYADIVLVARVAGQPAGYVSSHLSEPSRGKIGLLGVHREAVGKGIGRQLVESSLRWFCQEGATDVTVVTQGRNLRAQRLYQQCGFIAKSVQLWYHRWFVHGETGVST